MQENIWWKIIDEWQNEENISKDEKKLNIWQNVKKGAKTKE